MKNVLQIGPGFVWGKVSGNPTFGAVHGTHLQTHFLSSREHDLVVFPSVYLELVWLRRVFNHKVASCESTRASHIVVCHRGSISGRFLRVLELIRHGS